MGLQISILFGAAVLWCQTGYPGKMGERQWGVMMADSLVGTVCWWEGGEKQRRGEEKEECEKEEEEEKGGGREEKDIGAGGGDQKLETNCGDVECEETECEEDKQETVEESGGESDECCTTPFQQNYSAVTSHISKNPS